MNRQLWTQARVSRNSAPLWPCPACRRAHLRLDAKSLRAEETKDSRDARLHEDWEPEWMSYIFSAWMKCSDPRCAECAVVTGTGGVAPEWSEEEGMTWEDYFVPLTLSPMPDVIEIPQKCPPEVAEELRAAFRLVWSDPAASANRIRTAIERLMDALGIKRRTRGKNGLADLSLHARLVQFQKREPVLGAALIALKYTGNTGSHGKVEHTDVIDALEIIEHVLAEVVTQRSRNIAAIAKKLTKKHAPRRKAKAAPKPAKTTRKSASGSPAPARAPSPATIPGAGAVGAVTTGT